MAWLCQRQRFVLGVTFAPSAAGCKRCYVCVNWDEGQNLSIAFECIVDYEDCIARQQRLGLRTNGKHQNAHGGKPNLFSCFRDQLASLSSNPMG